jgi:hypothetical protein
VLGVIEHGNALELPLRFKTSCWSPAIVRKCQSSSPLDLDWSEKRSERALCVESRCGAVAVGRTYL